LPKDARNLVNYGWYNPAATIKIQDCLPPGANDGNYQGKILRFLLLACCALTSANANRSSAFEDEFGPVVRAYLGYLKNEQEVVDDRVIAAEVSAPIIDIIPIALSFTQMAIACRRVTTITCELRRLASEMSSFWVKSPRSASEAGKCCELLPFLGVVGLVRLFTSLLGSTRMSRPS
jgi:hypothetical protein